MSLPTSDASASIGSAVDTIIIGHPFRGTLLVFPFVLFRFVSFRSTSFGFVQFHWPSFTRVTFSCPQVHLRIVPTLSGWLLRPVQQPVLLWVDSPCEVFVLG